MKDLTTCPICGSTPLSTRDDTPGRFHYVSCPRCSEFVIEARFVEDGDLEQLLGPMGSRKRGDASCWLSRDPGVTNLRTREALERLAEVRAPRVLDRTELLLLMLEKKSQSVGEQININTDEFLAGTWSLDRREVTGLARLLEEFSLVTIGTQTLGDGGHVPVQIGAQGWHRLEELRRGDVGSQQGFVAMWFCDEMKQVYDDAFEPAIRAAGYRAHRVDKREYEGKIDDEIVAQIRRSRFVVADYTGHRGGVYYEAGFAHGLGLPVFFTCRIDEFDDLHFDIRQYNTIVWKECDELTISLQMRIESVLGVGSLLPNSE